MSFVDDDRYRESRLLEGDLRIQKVMEISGEDP
jgi:hypothetical protein